MIESEEASSQAKLTAVSILLSFRRPFFEIHLGEANIAFTGTENVLSTIVASHRQR
jgi:hypothetical protein